MARSMPPGRSLEAVGDDGPRWMAAPALGRDRIPLIGRLASPSTGSRASGRPRLEGLSHPVRRVAPDMGEMLDRILDGLNEGQREAVLTARGPVVILAGAGTGKTTTVTRRIAAQVASDCFDPRQILALTFSAKAAAELRERLSHLDVAGVRAVTFHAEALGQFRKFLGDGLEILGSKAQVLHGIAKRLPKPACFTPLRELATEIEWAKNRRVGPKTYLERLDGHQPPIEAELMHRVFLNYEREKRRRGVLDFEDLLERVVVHLAEHDRDLGVVRSRYASFTVDEYQDVNLLQQTLLDTWVGARDDVCVVGDDYQSIYGFTGATPTYLRTFADRYPDARIVTLRENYRSTPQVLEVANRLAAQLSTRPRLLEATRGDGPPVRFVTHETGQDEVRAIVAAIREEIAAGTPPSEIAILVRINARTEAFEEALAAARIGYQVRDGSFLHRPAARGFLARVRRLDPEADVAHAVHAVTAELGYLESPDTDLPDEERSRQEDLLRLRQFAEGSAAPGLAAFCAELRARFSADEDADGVQLMTLHRAKGLEFDVVFLPEIEGGTLPISHAKTAEEIAEERRLLYVGLTRARRRLVVSRARTRPGQRPSKPKPSPFWHELVPSAPVGRVASAPVQARSARKADDPRFGALRAWRSERAKEQGVPAYLVFADATLAEIASRMPSTREELRSISGVGPMKLSRYGEDLLAVLSSLREAG